MAKTEEQEQLPFSSQTEHILHETSDSRKLRTNIARHIWCEALSLVFPIILLLYRNNKIISLHFLLFSSSFFQASRCRHCCASRMAKTDGQSSQRKHLSNYPTTLGRHGYQLSELVFIGLFSSKLLELATSKTFTTMYLGVVSIFALQASMATSCRSQITFTCRNFESCFVQDLSRTVWLTSKTLAV